MNKGRFGVHGGQYIPETLMNAVIELEKAYEFYKNDAAFNRELTELLNEYAGRPSRLYYAKKMTREKRIPFEVSVDPFYSEANMNYLKRVISDIETGKTELHEHELIEE